MSRLRRKSSFKPDLPFLITVVALLVFGLLMVYDSSVVYAHDVFGGKYHFLLLHVWWVLAGSAVAFFVYSLDYHIWERFSLLLFILTIFMLVLVLLPGVGVQVWGATRWIDVGKFNVQPTEVLKFTFILYVSSWLSSLGTSKKKRYSLLMFLGILAVVFVPILLQPDLGTALVVGAIGVCLYFVSGAPLWHFFAIFMVAFVGGSSLIFSSAYRRERLLTYFNPGQADPLGSGYHINQILIALGSGGLTGLGVGNSRQKYLYLPSVTMDSIFAVVGEEFGFIGAAFFIILFGFLFWRGFYIANRAPDKFGKLLACGVVSWFAIQTLVNLAAMTALVPLTGIPLPLISYGGSSTIINLAGVGLLLSVSRYAQS